jgi:polysaccharide biosynthesis protein PslA
LQQQRLNIWWYTFADFLAGVICWNLYYFFRKVSIGESVTAIGIYFWLGQIIFPLVWCTIYKITGAYTNLYNKSVLTEFGHIAVVSFLGSVQFMFLFIFNDATNATTFLRLFFTLLCSLIIVTFIFRAIILAFVQKQVTRNKVYFNTLIVGDAKNAESLFKRVVNNKENTGFNIIGYINSNGANSEFLKNLGSLNNIERVIIENRIEEVLITINANERAVLEQLLTVLSNVNVNIKLVPDRIDVLSGSLRTTNVMGIPLIDIHNGVLPSWQQNLKRIIDVVLSIFSLIVLSPIFLYAAIKTLLSSPGPIFFYQERLGYKAQPFKMIKFRSMRIDAETNGPQLSFENDPRATPWGKFMRKWRIDELPQLVNILKGEMSFIGPRPERDFYAKQIIAQRAEYKFLFKVKPGLSSWGMVQFGYAENVEEMIERMQYDLIYLENISLLVDFKIMLYTLKIIWQGNGK